MGRADEDYKEQGADYAGRFVLHHLSGFIQKDRSNEDTYNAPDSDRSN
jgi:hypothetical protein